MSKTNPLLFNVIRDAIRRIEKGFEDATKVFTGKLERSVGLVGVVIISLSAMLGPGVFVLPALATEIMGSGIWLAFLLAAIVVLPGALSKSELASAMPASGGTYTFIEKTYGPVAGSIAGLGLWSSLLLKSAFALIGFGAYFAVLTAALDIDLSIKTTALALLAVITLINILGMKKVKAIQAPIIVVSIVLLIVLCIMSFFSGKADMARPANANAFSTGTIGLLETTAFVFVAYTGVTKVAAIGEEVKDPGKNLPRGMLISLAIATIIYTVVSYCMMATVSPEDLKGREDPIYVFAKAIGGSKLALFTAIIAVVTMVSGALAGLLGASRFPFGMARDNLLPESLENVHPRFETPHVAIMLTSIAMAFTILYLPVEDIAKLASGFKIMVFIAVHSCVLVLRRANTSHQWYRPEYRSPMAPWVQWFGIISGLVLIYLMGIKAIIGGAAAIILGFALWLSYGRKHAVERETPWNTVTKLMRNPDHVEHARREAVFHACDLGGKNHLNVRQFIRAMESLGFELNHDEIRTTFHVADENADGVIDIDEFLAFIEGEIGKEAEE